MILTQMTQKLMLRAEVGMRVRSAQKESLEWLVKQRKKRSGELYVIDRTPAAYKLGYLLCGWEILFPRGKAS